MPHKTSTRKLLLQALSITAKVKQRMQPFMLQISNHNIQQIFLIFSELYTYISLPEVDVNLKFNSLVAVKILLDSCQFEVVLMVEVYLLGLVKKVASYQLNMPEKTRGLDYFSNNGHEKSTYSKKLGYNFVRLACEMISIFAIVKPYALYGNQQIAQSSEFATALAYLRSQGWKEYDELAFYHQSPLKMRIAFLKKLQLFKEHISKYQSFIKQALQNIIPNNLTPIGLDPKKLIEFNETYACNQTLRLLKQFSLHGWATTIANVFRMVTDMISWGNFGAVYAIQIQNILDEFIETIAKMCVEDRNSKTELIAFQKLQGLEQEKANLYHEILRSLSIWAICIPKDPKDNTKQSKATQYFRKFALQMSFKFPIASSIKKVRNQCFGNMQKNKTANQRWLKQNAKEIRIDFNRRRLNSVELKQLFKGHFNQLRRTPTDNESICMQKSNEYSGCRFAKRQNSVERQLSNQSDTKKNSFTQQFFRQKKRKTQFYQRQFDQKGYSGEQIAYNQEIPRRQPNDESRQPDQVDQSSFSQEMEEGAILFAMRQTKAKVMMKDISKGCAG